MDVDRRGFLVLTGAALTEPAMQWIVQDIRDSVGSNGVASVSSDTAAGLRRIIDELGRLDERFGGAAIHGMVRENLGFVTGMLAEQHLSDHVRLNLLGCAARLSTLAGWIAFDEGRQAAAQQYYLAALRAAHTADDRSFGAHIIECMSYQACTAGRPAEAADLAAAAVRHLRGRAQPRVVSLLSVREAQAHAALGHRRQAELLLSRSMTLFGRGNPHEAPKWSWWFGEAEIAGMAARTYLSLGDHRRAEHFLQMALDRIDPSFARGRSLYLGQLGLARLGSGDLEQGCAIGMDLLKASHSVRSARVEQVINDLAGALKPFQKNRHVIEFFDVRRG
jgi:tetratricopeptide (TPR) repeat protein